VFVAEEAALRRILGRGWLRLGLMGGVGVGR
jgi:hypothetical protein